MEERRQNDIDIAVLKKAVEDLERTPTFLADVQQSILKCYEIEKKAFQTLSSII
ncbi:MAG: hypothetical protein NTW48_08985 [Chloroflexi bacterium]|nr:hypothetical protein [Chloroflexota bacterium]